MADSGIKFDINSKEIIQARQLVETEMQKINTALKGVGDAQALDKSYRNVEQFSRKVARSFGKIEDAVKGINTELAKIDTDALEKKFDDIGREAGNALVAGIEKAIKGIDFDKAIRDAKGASGQIGKALSSGISDIKINLQVDDSQLSVLDGLGKLADKSVKVSIDADTTETQNIIDALAKVDANQTIKVGIDADTEETQSIISALKSVSQNQTIKVGILADTEEAKQALKALGALRGDTVATVDIKAGTDETKQIISALNQLDENITATVDIKAGTNESEQLIGDIADIKDKDVIIDVSKGNTSELETIKDELEYLNTLASLNIVVAGAGLIPDVEGIDPFGSISRLQNEASLNALVPEASKVKFGTDVLNDIATDTFIDAFGGDEEEVRGTLIYILRSLGDRVNEYTEEDIRGFLGDSLTFPDIDGIEGTEAFQLANEFTKLGQVEDPSAGLNLIAKGINEAGLNQGGEALDVFLEYARQLADIGMPIEVAFNVAGQALQGGVQNLDYLFDFIKEFKNVKIAEILKGDNELSTIVTQLDLDDDAELVSLGEQSVGTFLNSFFDALDEQFKAFPDERLKLDGVQYSPALILESLGITQIEEIGGFSLLPNIDFEGSGIFENNEGYLASLQEALYDTESTAFTSFVRAWETAISVAFTDAIGGTEFLEKLKVAGQTFAGAIIEGDSIAEAFAKAFEVPLESVNDLESALGRFIIDFQVALSSVIGFLGGDTAGIDANIQATASKQLLFDLGTASSEQQIADALAQARAYGLDDDRLVGLQVDAFNDLKGAGEYGQAQFLLDRLQDSSGQLDLLRFREEIGGKQGFGNFSEDLDTILQGMAIRALGLPSSTEGSLLGGGGGVGGSGTAKVFQDTLNDVGVTPKIAQNIILGAVMSRAGVDIQSEIDRAKATADFSGDLPSVLLGGNPLDWRTPTMPDQDPLTYMTQLNDITDDMAENSGDFNDDITDKALDISFSAMVNSSNSLDRAWVSLALSSALFKDNVNGVQIPNETPDPSIDDPFNPYGDTQSPSGGTVYNDNTSQSQSSTTNVGGVNVNVADTNQAGQVIDNIFNNTLAQQAGGG